MNQIYYCVYKPDKTINSVGFLPDSWGGIVGVPLLSYDELKDLNWAGYPDHAFLKLEDVIELEFSKETIDTALTLGAVIEGNNVKNKRYELLTQTDWVVTRSIELNVPITDQWKEYRQSLRDITLQTGYPWSVVFPAPPE